MKDQVISRLKSVLPMGIAEKAIANFNTELALAEVSGNNTFLSSLQAIEKVSRMIECAFVWCETPEGETFWSSIHKSMVEKLG